MTAAKELAPPNLFPSELQNFVLDEETSDFVTHWKSHKFMKTLMILCSLVLTLTARATPIVFTDNTFKLKNYSHTSVFKDVPQDKVAWSQCPHCGDPGQALHIQMRLPQGSSFAAVGFINKTFSYNPQAQGTIFSIDASVDKNIITNAPPAPPNQSYTNTFRPLIEQDGMFYLAAISGPTFTHGGPTGFNTISQTGLVATDFTLFDFTAGTLGSAHPDFSGDAMLFGLGQLTGFGPANIFFRANYDNLEFVVNTQVPETGSTALLLLGSIAALFGLRRCSSLRARP